MVVVPLVVNTPVPESVPALNVAAPSRMTAPEPASVPEVSENALRKSVAVAPLKLTVAPVIEAVPVAASASGLVVLRSIVPALKLIRPAPLTPAVPDRVRLNDICRVLPLPTA